MSRRGFLEDLVPMDKLYVLFIALKNVQSFTQKIIASFSLMFQTPCDISISNAESFSRPLNFSTRSRFR